MTNISDDFFLIGLGALAFALVYTLLRRAYHATRQHMRSLQFAQRMADVVAAYRRPRRIARSLHGAPAFNQVAADTPAAPHAP